MSNFKMDDYVPVNERIEAFTAQFPDGSLQSEIVELTAGRVTVKAFAYRNEDDPRPGIGHSSLEIPGATSFTRGSEIENAETSAWGRAIAALGFEVKRGVSSREEVRNKQPERVRGGSPSSPSAPSPVRSPEEQALLDELVSIPSMSKARLSLLADAVGVPKGERANADQLRAMLARTIEQPDAERALLPSGDGAAPVARGGDGSSDQSPPPTSPDELLQSVLDVTGGTLVESAPADPPPRPQTDAYRALAAPEKAAARAYWQEQDARPLAEQLGAPLA